MHATHEQTPKCYMKSYQIKHDSRKDRHVRTVLFPPFLVVGQHGRPVVVHDAAAAAAAAPACRRARSLRSSSRRPHVGEVAVRERRARPADPLILELGEDPLRHEPEDVVEVHGEAARPHAAQAQHHLRHSHSHGHLHYLRFASLSLPEPPHATRYVILASSPLFLSDDLRPAMSARRSRLMKVVAGWWYVYWGLV